VYGCASGDGCDEGVAGGSDAEPCAGERVAGGESALAEGEDDEGDWNSLAMSARLTAGFVAAAGDGVDLGGALAAADGVAAGAAAVFVAGGAGDGEVPFDCACAGCVAGTDPKVLTPWGFRVGTEAGEEDMGAETSSMDPNVTEEPVNPKGGVSAGQMLNRDRHATSVRVRAHRLEGANARPSFRARTSERCTITSALVRGDAGSCDETITYPA
jgi:hypothetical protein